MQYLTIISKYLTYNCKHETVIYIILRLIFTQTIDVIIYAWFESHKATGMSFDMSHHFLCSLGLGLVHLGNFSDY